MTERRPDADIHRDVLEELRGDGRIRETDVGVLVHDHVVTLTGNVPTFSMKVAAQEVAHRVEGVLDVVNDVEVRLAGVGAPDDTAIAHAVREALAAEPRIPEANIHTTTCHGIVTLEGHVETPAQRDEASNALRRLRGVVGIINRLDIARPPARHDELRNAVQQAIQRHALREADRIVIDVANGVVTLRGAVDSWPERRAIVGGVRGAPGVIEVVDELSVVGREPS